MNIKSEKIKRDTCKNIRLLVFGKCPQKVLTIRIQKRVSIARAIARKPKMLLCDKPTGALDYQTGKQVNSEINRH